MMGRGLANIVAGASSPVQPERSLHLDTTWTVKPAGKALTLSLHEGVSQALRGAWSKYRKEDPTGRAGTPRQLPRGRLALKAVTMRGPRADGRPCLSREQVKSEPVWRCKSASSAGPRVVRTGRTKVPCLPVQPVSMSSTWKTR